LSRNPINFEEVDCNVINYNKFLNPNNPKDAEIISQMLEKTDEEEDEDFELYLSDDERFDNLNLEEDLLDGNTDSISVTQEDLCESPKLQITEGVLIHDPPNDRILTRSQTKSRNIDRENLFKNLQRNKDEIEEIENRNDSPDKGSDEGIDEDDKNTDDEEEKSVINNDNENQIPRIKPNIIDIQTFKK